MKKLMSLLFVLKCINALASTVTTNNTLYYSAVNRGDNVDVNTNQNASLTPLQGYGAYLVNGEYYLNLSKIITRGSTADAIRTNGGNNVFYTNELEISVTGSSADAVNLAANQYDTKYISLLYVKDQAKLTSGDGVTVRANNFVHADSKAIAMLPNNSILKNTMTGTASNSFDSKGYTVYAGNRDNDYYGFLNYLNTKGNAFVFVGDNSQIESNAKNGHAVYANKGGLIHLGDKTQIVTNGQDAYAIFASTERQASFSDNIRPGKVYLKGGVLLRANNSSNVIQAKGADSFIKSGYIDIPVIDDTYVRGTDITIDETTFQPSSGKFDVMGNISAIEGGYISLNMDDASTFVGSTSIDTGNNSNINLNISDNGSIWEMTKDSSLSTLTIKNGAIFTLHDDPARPTTMTISGNIINDKGIIDLSSPTHNTYDTLIIDGDYTGNDGLLKLDTALGNDLSSTDKVVITGNSAGTSNVEVTNIGGLGAATIEGIKVIEVQGNSTGVFNKAGRIVAGAYEYFLERGDGILTDVKNWYLTSSLTPTPPGPTPPGPTPPGPTPLGPIPPEPIPTPQTPTYRPEVGSYLANSIAVNGMFVHGFHDRLGENQYFYRAQLGRKKYDIWTRNVANYSSFRDGSRQLKTSTNGYAFQVGGNLIHHTTKNNNHILVGIMGGFGFNNSTTHSNRVSFSSKGQVEGYSLGLYASYYNNKNEDFGYYADSWLTHSWFDNEVKGDGLRKESYRSKGFTYSLEGGFYKKIGESSSKNNKYYIQPKAQVIYMGVRTKDHREHNGTLVENYGKGNVQSRVGAKIYLSKTQYTRKGINKIQPYMEFNWVHNTRDHRVAMDGVKSKRAGSKDIAEAKIGIDVNMRSDFNIYANVAQEWGRKSYRNTKVTVGFKYRF